jgi:NodT family efflux transporter outer membrane factor (OMF) lipoprotein
MTAWRIGRRAARALAMPVLLAGCTVGPDFIPPEPQLPETSFYGDKASKGARLPEPTDPTWWAVFRDPILTGLERRVAAENLDVQTAAIRLAESRFQRGVAAAAQFPSVNGDAKYQRELYSKNGLLSLLGALLPPSAGGSVPISPINEYNIGFDASWELDLWGHVRRQVEAADAQVDQAAEQRRDALVSSLAELARDYIQLRGVQAQIQIAVDNLHVDEDILLLARDRALKGMGTGLDVENAAAQVEGIRAQLPTFEQQESQYINALSLLLDQSPGALRPALARPKAVPAVPPRVPLGIPSELARRRPDIRVAEAQLHAATADIGVAVASFYPTVQLNGTVGFDALDLRKLWQVSSLQYNAGPSVTLPIFAGGRLKSTLELRKAQQQEAAIQYRKTVLQAWHEVVNALVAYRFEQQRRERLKLQTDHSRQVLTLARARYADGVADFLTVLDAERTLLQVDQQYATSTTNVSMNLVQLFKALGGGWEQTFPDSPAAKGNVDP